MAVNVRVLMRKGHRWGAILVAVPFLVVIVTGILLQLKKEIPWVQPPTQRGAGRTPTIAFEAILDAARSRPDAGIEGWGDIDRIDVQPSRGLAKVTSKSRWEIQVDLKSGEVLHSAFRRSDLIESLHDGSWFHDAAKLYVFLPTAVVVFGLWVSGLYLFFLPIAVRWRRKPVTAAPPPSRSA
jgi:uncharacterized iron-regulated membrane protein